MDFVWACINVLILFVLYPLKKRLLCKGSYQRQIKVIHLVGIYVSFLRCTIVDL